MPLSLTEFRANLFKIVDQVIKTGVPIEIERKGIKIKLVPEKQKTKIQRLTKHPDTIKGDPDSLIHLDWSSEKKQWSA